MLTLLLGLALLFLLACLLRWWARGGVIPAIMLSLPVLAFLPVLAVSIHDKAAVENLVYAPCVILALLALAWGPRTMRRRAGWPIMPEPPHAPRPLRPYQPVVRKPLTPRQIERRGALRWGLCSGAATALVLTAYSLITAG